MPDAEKEALCARIDELCAEVEQLRQENQSIGMAAYEVGYKDGSTHYELDHCPACKNVADLQEALDENAKLRELCADMGMCLTWQWEPHGYMMDGCDHCRFKKKTGGMCGLGMFRGRMRELGIEVG